MFHEYKQHTKALSGQQDSQMPAVDFGTGYTVDSHIAEVSVAVPANGSCSQVWSDYVIKLSGVLCSFLPSSEDVKSQDVELSTGRITVPVSSKYCDSSIRWILMVLQTVFPCIKACSDQNDLTIHLRLISCSYMCIYTNLCFFFVRYSLLYSSMLLPLRYKLSKFCDKNSVYSQSY